MAVRGVSQRTGETITRKVASIEGGTTGVFSGIMADKKGRFRGCGKKQLCEAAAAKVIANDPQKKIRER